MWNGLWPTQAIVLALLALGISSLLPALGPWLHSILLLVAAAWLGWTLWQRRDAWTLPSREDAVRRLERDNGVEHRPLQAMADRPLDDSPTGRALWAAHQRQLAARLDALQPRMPANDLPRRDRYAWRAGAFLALAVAVGAAGYGWYDRLAESLQPRFASAAPAAAPAIELWAEPPAYTGRAPIFAPPSGEELRLPVGSSLIARVSNAESPSLRLDDRQQPLAEEAPGQYALTLEVGDATSIAVESGGAVLARWPVTVVPDMPPSATLRQAPSATERQALRLDYALYDDYGVAEAWAELRLAEDERLADLDEVLRLPFPLGNTARTEVQSSAFHDLTPHRWAGHNVLVRIVARDAMDQAGSSETMAVQLPERVFTHPVARQIIAARKQLDRGAPHIDVARSLAEIASYPGRFDHDTVVYLAISSSFHRLRHGDDRATKTAVRDVLWDTALRVEDGALPTAERELRAAQQALHEALARDAPQEEIRRLVAELREAMRRFAAELANRAGEPPLDEQAGERQQSIAGEDLERMLDRIQELAETGARDAAQNLLSQLQQMLENVRQAQRMSPEQRQQAEQMTQMLNQLREMQRRQQSLIDRTFQQDQQNQPSPTGPPNPNAGQPQQSFQFPNFGMPNTMPRGGQQPGQQQGGQPMPGLAGEQDQLRRDLGELMRQMGERFGSIPGGMQQAEQAMRAARDSLQQGAGQPALDAEGEALEHLSQMAEGMSQQLANRLGMGQQGVEPGSGMQPGSSGNNRPGRRDPLGREGVTGQTSESGPHIPEESDMQRARRIRDTLYERSADPNRPIPEQNYLKRLLEQF